MHVGSGAVARLPSVYHDHSPPLTPELQGGGQPSRRAPDDANVAVPLDCRDVVVHHGQCYACPPLAPL